MLTPEERERYDEDGRPYCDQCFEPQPRADQNWYVVEYYDTLEFENGHPVSNPSDEENAYAFCSDLCLGAFYTDMAEVLKSLGV